VIVLDTNVVSELARSSPDPAVVRWLDSVSADEVTTTAVTAAELFHGVARLPASRKKTRIADAVQRVLRDDLQGRVEPFDIRSAERYGILVADRERAGKPITVADAQIAAICTVRRATLATRNTKDFVDTGIELVNPWGTDLT
jgi:predicted nucleic acid-binding protein